MITIVAENASLEAFDSTDHIQHHESSIHFQEIGESYPELGFLHVGFNIDCASIVHQLNLFIEMANREEKTFLRLQQKGFKQKLKNSGPI